MNVRHLRAIEERLRHILVLAVSDPHLKAGALKDLRALVDGVKDLNVELRQLRPAPMTNIRATIEANAPVQWELIQ